MEYEKLSRWFTDTDMGIYTSTLERHFFEQSSADFFVSKSVQFGMEEWLRPSEKCICIGKDIYMDTAVWAWEQSTLDLLLMPHTLETNTSTEQILSQAFQTLKPEGRIILTGFNPYSLWRLRNWFNGKYLPEARYCHPLPDLKKQLEAIGFQIDLGKFMVYLPPFKTNDAMKLFQFMEAAGNRWWPHAASVYGLVLKKRVAGMRLTEEWSEAVENNIEVVLGSAKWKID
ncbi:putative methyltransferase [Neisseria zoodegmatis]|uniref:Putative methyltransferase n=1 Tax=Neisseria zoodegmatis TaxID=326523 RepID=A0A378WHF6_9NEIS|nr:methyltransferase [Neisseria zoodegmatis]SUA35974.1 putative methyltransferase [Neisseria zoodegmatis]